MLLLLHITYVLFRVWMANPLRYTLYRCKLPLCFPNSTPSYLLLCIILCVGYYNYQTPIHCIRIMTSIHALAEQTILFKCILIYILCMLCTFHTIVSVFYSVNTDYCNANWILMAKTHKVVTCSYICMITTPQVVVGTAQG